VNCPRSAGGSVGDACNLLGPGALGMLIGCYSAWFAFAHARAAGIEGSSALVIAAFALALGAGLVPLLIRRRLMPAALVMLVCGAVGYGASALYSTHTVYVVALFC
jgi:hypothetical protein